MSTTTTKIGLAALLTGALLAGQAPLAGQASAQKAAPAPPAPAGQPAGAPPQNPNGPVKIQMQTLDKTDWTKICPKAPPGSKALCMTTRDFTTAQNQPPPVALAIYDVKGEDARILRILLPVGLLLKPGIRLAVDKGPMIEGSFQFCMPNGCFAEARVNGKALAEMKKGTDLNIVAKGMANNEVTFALPLAGFGKGFDGPAIPPEVIAKEQQEMQAALQKQLQERAQAQREQLEKGAAAASPSPAAGTPAPGAPAPAAPAAPKP